MHSSWAKLRSAFLASSLKTQQQQKQQQKLPGPKMTLAAKALMQSARKAPKAIKDVQEPSAAALRYRKFVRGLKSSFSGLSSKSRRQLLGEPQRGSFFALCALPYA